MIQKFSTKSYKKKRVYANCDDLSLPFWGIDEMFTNDNAIPFIYGKKNNGEDFVLLGERGAAHFEIFYTFKNELADIGIKNKNNVLNGRVWNIKSTVKNGPNGILTFWASEGPFRVSSKLVEKIVLLLKKQNIDVSNYTIVYENYVYHGQVTVFEESNDENQKNGVYAISVPDYISLRCDSLEELPEEFERQEKKRSMSNSGMSSRWKDWDYKGQGIGYLGYHLMTRQDENNNKKNVKNMKTNKIIELNEAKLKKIVSETLKRALNELGYKNNFMNKTLKEEYYYDDEGPSLSDYEKEWVSYWFFDIDTQTLTKEYNRTYDHSDDYPENGFEIEIFPVLSNGGSYDTGFRDRDGAPIAESGPGWESVDFRVCNKEDLPLAKKYESIIYGLLDADEEKYIKDIEDCNGITIEHA